MLYTQAQIHTNYTYHITKMTCSLGLTSTSCQPASCQPFVGVTVINTNAMFTPPCAMHA